MLKAEIKKEITITNKEAAEYLWVDGGIFDSISEILEDMLHTEYDMNYDARRVAVGNLTDADYVEILKSLADKITKDGILI